jgi:aspartate 1-decarboxylase
VHGSTVMDASFFLSGSVRIDVSMTRCCKLYEEKVIVMLSVCNGDVM